LVGVAVNVTEVPEHIGFADAVMETLTGIKGLTTIVIALEVAGFPVAQPRFEVNIHVRTSPFAGV